MTGTEWKLGGRAGSANRRRVLQALVGIGLLATLVALPSAQAGQGGRKVSGTVVEAVTQLPVPHAAVQYKEAGLPPQTTVTDSRGHFEFPSGRLGVVRVTAKNFSTARRRWPPISGFGSLTVDLKPPAILRGTVSDLATGRPVSALVRMLVQHPGNFVMRTASAEHGMFEMVDLPPGPALMTVRSQGFAPFVGSTTVEEGKVRDVRIGLLLEAQAAGHVRDGGGKPVAGATVSAVYPELGGDGLVEDFVGGWPLTRADGAFSLNGLIPDTPIALQAELGGRRSAMETIEIVPGMRQLDIVLTLP